MVVCVFMCVCVSLYMCVCVCVCVCLSVAILQYMVEKFPQLVPGHWYPSDLQRRALVNEFLSWQHTALRAHGSKVFWFRVGHPAAS